MDPKQVKVKRKARKTLTVRQSCKQLQKNYKITVHSNNEITDTGLLTVAELAPKKGKSGPRFRFRWDEKAVQLDVDALDVSPELKKQFEEGITGYEGHHTVRLSSTSRTFCVKVVWGNGTLYEGIITFPLAFEENLTSTIGLHVTASVVHLRHCCTCGKQFMPIKSEKTCADCDMK